MVKAKSSGKQFYGTQLPGLDISRLAGKLIVLEGADGSGRSTQINILRDWFEQKGIPTITVGIKRSELVSEEIELAMSGNTLSPITMGLFYATDFCDQLEKKIIPALKSGFVVLADRYIYTLMARDIVRGVSSDWVRDIYNFALIPDQIFYLKVTPEILAERNFKKNGELDFWESGMDIQRTGDMFECFIRYQRKIQRVFRSMQDRYDFVVIDGNRPPKEIGLEIKSKIQVSLKSRNAMISTRTTSRNKVMQTIEEYSK